MQFTVRRQRFELDAEEVKQALRDVQTERAHQYVVEVDWKLIPVKQAFEVAAVPKMSRQLGRRVFTSTDSRRVLKRLGFRIRRLES